MTSLGVHKPSALPFLIAEGILPPEPPENAFRWHAIGRQSPDGHSEEEEIIHTEFCVVWSKGGLIQRVFRFDSDGEPVKNAVFTRFPKQSSGDGRWNTQSSSSGKNQDGHPSEGLDVPKQRATHSKTELGKQEWNLDARSTVQTERQSHELVQGPSKNSMSTNRAIVIVLKTQTHIFFLSETNHIVHLPFEVDAVFPSIHGVILQRKLADESAVPPTPQLPSVPPNSFAFSQMTSSQSPPGSQPLADLASTDNKGSPILPMLKDLLQRSAQAPETQLPRLYCLTDPLLELGAVAVQGSRNIRALGRSSVFNSFPFTDLDPKESLLYVSPIDEISQAGLKVPESDPLLFAVTENEDSGDLSVWTASYLEDNGYPYRRRPTTPAKSGATSRRRSSFAPGLETGNSTPTLRSAIGGRESFGGARSRRHASTDPTSGEVSVQGQEDLLDPAFRNPTSPAKSSRRVSGLLARADLSISHERSTFTDPTGGVHAGGKVGRKGASFGMAGPRLSSGLETGPATLKTHSLHGIRTSLDSVSLHEHQIDESADELDEIHDSRELNGLGLNTAVQRCRTEMLLKKIYSMPGEDHRKQDPVSGRNNCKREVITMTTPIPSLGDASRDLVIIMGVVDRVARETLILHINASHTKRKLQQNQSSKIESSHYTARVSGMTRHSAVIDACKISEGPCSRLLILEQSKDGRGELSLQAPWTSPKNFELPPRLLLHHPYGIANDITLRRQREGGSKRILSQGPQALNALEHASENCFDAVDSEGCRHRIQLQFRPRSTLVDRIIKVADAVLPSSAVDGETILRGWWETVTWLQARTEVETDLEWIAIVVLIFAIGVAFVDGRRIEATPRQKKKKGGLLRSSSGANTNLESWEAMMSQEASKSGSTPAWLQSEAWKWVATEKHQTMSPRTPRSSGSTTFQTTNTVPMSKKCSTLIHYISLAREFVKSSAGQKANGPHGYLPTASSRDPDVRRTALASILVSLHLLREEFKLDTMAAIWLHQLTPLLAQLGTWLGWEAWGKTGFYLLENEDMESWLFEDLLISALKVPPEPFPPPSILQFIESTHTNAGQIRMISLLDVASSPMNGTPSKGSAAVTNSLLRQLTPRTVAITSLLTTRSVQSMADRVADLAAWAIDTAFLETLPESVAVLFRAAIASCQAQPPTVWKATDLIAIGREDIAVLERDRNGLRSNKKSSNLSSNNANRDVHTICHQALEVETPPTHDYSAELDRSSITRLLFKEDQRFAESAKLLHPLHYPVARCTPEPEWSDTELLEAQQELAKLVALRTLSVSLGRGMLYFGARSPLLTEKFQIHGFTLSCVMKPADTTVTADRNLFTEDKTSWAFFHAGAQAGLSISQDAKGIDTSWILFNKPRELTNRHAGFLLALGLNGHLKSIAKWVAFKYLTPKHTMTSIGLLLGLSASYLGTMDSLITRLLSVHVIRMLPPGAAELNLSPLTQTSGIMGIGLLYCNTQHRRMSEIMLSEMENTDQDDDSNPMENLRDEGYRLAAGFSLGYINLGRGKDLKGLYDMHITERLLVLAIGTREVEIIHILDKVAAAATLGIAIIFMKTQNEALARKIDVPDTPLQFDNVRPDAFLLRTVARHLIMWDDIKATSRWISMQLPPAYQHKSVMAMIRVLTSEDMPFFNVMAGICLSIALRFAGSGSLDVRDLLCHRLDQFIRICRLPALSYDQKLARATARNCQDITALAASCVMAGTGDLHVFRRLRSLHGRVDSDTPYGSHLATHFAIGVLFMGGGTHTFGTSNIAVASLLCAFYPLFPNNVLDNKSHLQAFRHFWVLATERRCLVPRDVDSHRPVSLRILVSPTAGPEIAMTAPCLLPEIQTISRIKTDDPEYWSVTLDIAENPSHATAFMRHQSIYVRRRAAYDAHSSVFSATMQALNDNQNGLQLSMQVFNWIFSLSAFAQFDRGEQALVLPTEAGNALYKGNRGTAVDDRLVLEKACLHSRKAERLWNLRILFAWAEGCMRRGEECGWLGNEVVERLRAGLAMRRWSMKEE